MQIQPRIHPNNDNLLKWYPNYPKWNSGRCLSGVDTTPKLGFPKSNSRNSLQTELWRDIPVPAHSFDVHVVWYILHRPVTFFAHPVHVFMFSTVAAWLKILQILQPHPGHPRWRGLAESQGCDQCDLAGSSRRCEKNLGKDVERLWLSPWQIAGLFEQEQIFFKSCWKKTRKSL